MIPDTILLFIVMLLLSYVFGNKILPQVAVFALALIEVFYIIETPSTITQDQVFQIILFIINMFYAGLSIIWKSEDT